MSGLSGPGMKGRVLAENRGSAWFQQVFCSVDRACNVLGLGAWGATGQPLSLGQQQGAPGGRGEGEQVALCLVPDPSPLLHLPLQAALRRPLGRDCRLCSQHMPNHWASSPREQRRFPDVKGTFDPRRTQQTSSQDLRYHGPVSAMGLRDRVRVGPCGLG